MILSLFLSRSLQIAQDIFGVDFDFADFDQYDEEEDEEDYDEVLVLYKFFFLLFIIWLY